MPVGERTVRSTRIFEGHVVSLRIDDVELPSGRTAQREIVEHRGAVGIVALTAAREVLLVRQYRTPIGRRLVEIPAGTVETGESPESCAQRELAEEIGMRAARWRTLTSMYPAPGFLTEVQHVFLAEELSPHVLDREEEDLEVVPVPLADAMRMVVDGEICDAKSVAGILLASMLLDGPR